MDTNLTTKVPNPGDRHEIEELDGGGVDTLVHAHFPCRGCEATYRIDTLGYGERCAECGAFGSELTYEMGHYDVDRDADTILDLADVWAAYFGYPGDLEGLDAAEVKTRIASHISRVEAGDATRV